MAEPDPHPQALAARLLDHADDITLPHQHEMETDMRAAAKILVRLDAPPEPLFVRITKELRTAMEFADAETRRRLENLIGPSPV